MNVVDGLQKQKIDFVENLLDSDIMVYSGSLDDSAIYPFIHLLERRDKKREKLSIILTTNGGSATVVERMVYAIRHHYNEVEFYIPDYAYSAGTIFCMSGDKIHMTYSSALGPIDPQVKNKDGRWVPALGYLDKFAELIGLARSGKISEAEFLILREFDMAEIHAYEKARDLTVDLLKNGLWNINLNLGKFIHKQERRLRRKRSPKGPRKSLKNWVILIFGFLTRAPLTYSA
jgi:hypothetical protein